MGFMGGEDAKAEMSADGMRRIGAPEVLGCHETVEHIVAGKLSVS